VTAASVPAAAAMGRPRLGRGGSLIPPPSSGSFGLPGPYVWDARTGRRVPAVGRALQLYGGMTKQLPLEVYRGWSKLPTPPICERPDPTNACSWFVQCNVEDYLLNGNAVSHVTARGAAGWPASVEWLPVEYVSIAWNPETNAVTYDYRGTEVPTSDIVHIKRGADRSFPVRGVGVVEEYVSTLDRAAQEEEYERSSLSDAAVPSIAVITPQATLTQEVADEAKVNWQAKFAGPGREPVILPNGTVVQPLSWSPTDTQLAEARRLTLLDVANMFNLDGYWLGAPVAGMTYRTAGPQYQQILRTSIEPVLADFEDVWSYAWLPRGQKVRFHRAQLLREDLPTAVAAATSAYGAGLISLEEARAMIGLPPDAVGIIGTDADVTGQDPDPPEIPEADS
jgi:HK97 family phage portal protein